MAIIYETKEDFERDKLKEQHAEMRHKATREVGTAAAAMLGSSVVSSFNKDGSSRMLSLASLALTAVGVVELAKSFFTGSKAHDLKLKHDRMGPQATVLPPDVPVPDTTDCHACHTHHTNKITPTTLLEQVAKVGGTLER